MQMILTLHNDAQLYLKWIWTSLTWLNFVMVVSLLSPLSQKVDARFKSGQKCLENNRLALLV